MISIIFNHLHLHHQIPKFDVCIFAPIKRKLCEGWTQWYIKDDKTYTCHDNMRSPGYTVVIEWLSEIWRDFDSNIIIRSFDYCGITSQTNIHCALRSITEDNKVLWKM